MYARPPWLTNVPTAITIFERDVSAAYISWQLLLMIFLAVDIITLVASFWLHRFVAPIWSPFPTFPHFSISSTSQRVMIGFRYSVDDHSFLLLYTNLPINQARVNTDVFFLPHASIAFRAEEIKKSKPDLTVGRWFLVKLTRNGRSGCPDNPPRSDPIKRNRCTDSDIF